MSTIDKAGLVGVENDNYADNRFREMRGFDCLIMHGSLMKEGVETCLYCALPGSRLRHEEFDLYQSMSKGQD